jgi:hypothetical protein
MIKLIDLLNEYSVNKPGKLKLPDGWESFDVDSEPDLEEDIEVESYGAPMEGWDKEHYDYINIMKTPDVDPETEQPLRSEYYVLSYFAFGEAEEDDKRFNSLLEARKRAVELMEKLSQEWDTDEEELDEYEIKKPTLFNTDSSKGKLWVDYNPKLRKIDGKELSLLNRVYSALKPVENRLDDSLRLSPSLDRVMMKYGYWEWIEDREILKALKDFNVEIEDDYDDDRGQTTYYMVKDK